MEAAGEVRRTVGQLQIGRHASGRGGRGHAAHGGGAPHRVLPTAGRAQLCGRVLEKEQ